MEEKYRKALSYLWQWFVRWLKRWFIVAFSGMALGLFSTLIIGTIIKQIGKLFGEGHETGQIFMLAGGVASMLTGCGIGAGIAFALKADRLVMFSCIVAGYCGAQANNFMNDVILSKTGPGDPIGSFFAAIIACEVGIILKDKTKLDIIVLPFFTILTGILVVFTICPTVIGLMDAIGDGIKKLTELQPFIMGILVSVITGLLLTLPTSSAAICVALKMDGIAGAAGAVGGAAQMVGFAVMSFRENKWSGLISQGLGTSMLQIPNIFQKPILLIPPIVASIIVGPIASSAMKLQCDYAGSGMGTAGLVGVISTYTESVDKGVKKSVIWLGIVFLFFIIPAVVSLGISEFMRYKKWIKPGDLALEL